MGSTWPLVQRSDDEDGGRQVLHSPLQTSQTLGKELNCSPETEGKESKHARSTTPDAARRHRRLLHLLVVALVRPRALALDERNRLGLDHLGPAVVARRGQSSLDLHPLLEERLCLLLRLLACKRSSEQISARRNSKTTVSGERATAGRRLWTDRTL